MKGRPSGDLRLIHPFDMDGARCPRRCRKPEQLVCRPRRPNRSCPARETRPRGANQGSTEVVGDFLASPIITYTCSLGFDYARILPQGLPPESLGLRGLGGRRVADRETQLPGSESHSWLRRISATFNSSGRFAFFIWAMLDRRKFRTFASRTCVISLAFPFPVESDTGRATGQPR